MIDKSTDPRDCPIGAKWAPDVPPGSAPIDKDKFYSGPLGAALVDGEAPKCANCGGAYFAGLVPETLCGKCRQAAPAPARRMQPTDREMIEFAAKAAGKTRGEWDYDWLVGLGHEISRDMLWNPRENSGQALELAVKLRLTVVHYEGGVTIAQYPQIGKPPLASETGVDATTTCYAITRAAYEIGKAMP